MIGRVEISSSSENYVSSDLPSKHLLRVVEPTLGLILQQRLNTAPPTPLTGLVSIYNSTSQLNWVLFHLINLQDQQAKQHEQSPLSVSNKQFRKFHGFRKIWMHKIFYHIELEI